jgi:hypothetical protein
MAVIAATVVLNRGVCGFLMTADDREVRKEDISFSDTGMVAVEKIEDKRYWNWYLGNFSTEKGGTVVSTANSTRDQYDNEDGMRTSYHDIIIPKRENENANATVRCIFA